MTNTLNIHSCPDCTECSPQPTFAWCHCGLHIATDNGACEPCTARATEVQS